MSLLGVPEIIPLKFAEKLKADIPFSILDVREEWEFQRARIKDARVVLVPMSVLATKGIEALPKSIRAKEGDVIVVCHHGVRSAQATGWLLKQGWENVYSLAGGLEAYALQVDPTIGRY